MANVSGAIEVSYAVKKPVVLLGDAKGGPTGVLSQMLGNVGIRG